LPEASLLANRYEALRAAGFGQALPPEARSGLALLLRRGVWGWARAGALVCATAALQPNRTSSPKSTAAREHSAVIQIIAAMAMTTNDRRSA
jgi:hypothetical protein